ncbi:CLUMA_CG008869, isoform A [Clunio marinus]|uniref:CLUMA_CG008869, isoform A n=1 Tax=Clunio marinus TaxID=568069 RepID=A0A1J1I628_9DIPT|nr:CLUMA_CG008869, isoform A [Clunio marinus]
MRTCNIFSKMTRNILHLPAAIQLLRLFVEIIYTTYNFLNENQIIIEFPQLLMLVILLCTEGISAKILIGSVYVRVLAVIISTLSESSS